MKSDRMDQLTVSLAAAPILRRGTAVKVLLFDDALAFFDGR